MNIDKYWCEESGGYVNEKGIFMGETPEDTLCSLCDFCACGMPEEALSYVHGILRGIAGLKKIWDADELDNTAAYRALDEERSTFYGSEGAQYFALYWADDKGFIEHGFSIGNGWLTDKGEALLADLDELFPEQGEK